MGDSSDELVPHEDSSEYRIKIYKELARMSGVRPVDGSADDERLRRQAELAATRHPRWRGAGSHSGGA
jgi:hypothetical protein